MRKEYRYGFLLLVLIISIAPNQGIAQASSYGELQAAYLYNFAKYIKWPNDAPLFVIGVVSKDTETIELFESKLRGKKVGGKEIVVKKIKAHEESGDCNIVYLSESESKNLNSLIQEISGKSILVVTEDDLIKKGAMISFIVQDDNLKFKLKTKLILDAGLLPSEGLLKLAIQL